MKKASMASKQWDPNERDLNGCSGLHVAVGMGGLDMVETLLKFGRVDVNLQDLESGWTVMHKALYAGNLTMALMILRMRPNCDLTIRDKEGNTCLDLLMSTIDPGQSAFIESKDEILDTDENDDIESVESGDASPATPKEYATSVWTWGSNNNFVLGHRNSNDRPYPERIEIPPPT
ncbi:hypothetical protein HDU76_005856, partial [Blyttiomyces sp. JEL0837]